MNIRSDTGVALSGGSLRSESLLFGIPIRYIEGKRMPHFSTFHLPCPLLGSGGGGDGGGG